MSNSSILFFVLNGMSVEELKRLKLEEPKSYVVLCSSGIFVKVVLFAIAYKENSYLLEISIPIYDDSLLVKKIALNEISLCWINGFRS